MLHGYSIGHMKMRLLQVCADHFPVKIERLVLVGVLLALAGCNKQLLQALDDRLLLREPIFQQARRHRNVRIHA
jgi:hypothetical protein